MSQTVLLARKLKISLLTWAGHGRTSPETHNFVGTKSLLPNSHPIIDRIAVATTRIGPEKGVIHIATAAVGNAVWDMYARSRSKPLWKLVVDMTPVRSPTITGLRWLIRAHRKSLFVLQPFGISPMPSLPKKP